MRVLIFGANGRTGRLVTAAALKAGHTVTGLVRKASSLQPQEGLTIVEGTPLTQTDVEKAFDATPVDPVQAVLVSLNASRASDSPVAKPVAPPFFVRDCVRTATAVMQRYGVKRIIVMSAFGIGDSFQQLPWLMKLVFRYTNMKYQMEDHDATDVDVRQSTDIDWTLIRPVVLKEGDASTVKELGEIGRGVGLLSGITRASVAEFMISTAEQGSWSKKAVVIAN